MIDKILLIDDDPDDCFLFTKALKEVAPDTNLRCARSVTELEATLSSFLPDIIFIDINLSPRSGFNYLETLMSNPLFRTIPVVMHSSSQNPTHMALAYSLGANLYFKKPSNYKVLEMGLRKVLELDWMHPRRVKAGHFSNEKYGAFQVA